MGEKNLKKKNLNGSCFLEYHHYSRKIRDHIIYERKGWALVEIAWNIPFLYMSIISIERFFTRFMFIYLEKCSFPSLGTSSTLCKDKDLSLWSWKTLLSKNKVTYYDISPNCSRCDSKLIFFFSGSGLLQEFYRPLKFWEYLLLL